MDKPTTIAVIAATLTGLLSAGAFKFYEFVLKQRREVEKEEKAEQALYRDDLIKRVEKLEVERDESFEMMMKLREEMSAMKVQVEFMQKENEILKLRLEAIR
jgi:predicted nuclease with TOPRIM domain